MTRLIMSAVLLLAAVPAVGGDEPFTLYLVRHAEKVPDGSRDPALTRDGEARAQRLADWFQNRDLEAIWSSDYVRTQSTAKPTSERLGLAVGIYDPSALPHLAEQLLETGETALVVGHSNTTPELAALLCHCDVDTMPETEYDRLIRVVIKGDSSHLETLSQSSLPD